MKFKWRYVLSVVGTVIGLAIAAYILMPDDSGMALTAERTDALEIVHGELDTARTSYLQMERETLARLDSTLDRLADEAEAPPASEIRPVREGIETASEQLDELEGKSGTAWVRLRREIMDQVDQMELAVEQMAFRVEQRQWLADTRDKLDTLAPEARQAAEEDIDAARSLLVRIDELLDYPRYDLWKDWQGRRYLINFVREQAEMELARIERRSGNRQAADAA
jgi:hypothetical protein